jgi:hypothetical protein
MDIRFPATLQDHVPRVIVDTRPRASLLLMLERVVSHLLYDRVHLWVSGKKYYTEKNLCRHEKKCNVSFFLSPNDKVSSDLVS